MFDDSTTLIIFGTNILVYPSSSIKFYMGRDSPSPLFLCGSHTICINCGWLELFHFVIDLDRKGISNLRNSATVYWNLKVLCLTSAINSHLGTSVKLSANVSIVQRKFIWGKCSEGSRTEKKQKNKFTIWTSKNKTYSSLFQNKYKQTTRISKSHHSKHEHLPTSTRREKYRKSILVVYHKETKWLIH